MDELIFTKTASGDDSELAESCEAKGADFERVLAGRQSLLDDDTYLCLRETFRALADSTRLKIVHSLFDRELCTCDLAVIIGLSEPAISQHLRLLRALRLVRTRRVGKNVLYSLDDTHVRALLNVSLEHVRHNIQDHDSPADSPSKVIEPLNRVQRGG